MNLNYVNKKLTEKIFKENKSNENKIFIFPLYEGYDVYFFLQFLLDELKISKMSGNTYMINFPEYFIDLLNKYYNQEEKSTKKKSKTKNENYIQQLNTNNKSYIDDSKNFAVQERVFLKDLISKIIFTEQVATVIISPTTNFDLGEKIWCIQKFLFEKGKNITFIYLIQNIVYFNFFYNSLSQKIKLTKNNHYIYPLSRNSIIIDKIITRKLLTNNCLLFEIKSGKTNENEINIRYEIKKLLKQFMEHIHKEIKKFINEVILSLRTKSTDEKIISKLNELLNKCVKDIMLSNESSVKNIHFSVIHFLKEKNYNLHMLLNDLFGIKYLIRKCESYDIASLYNIFREIKVNSEKDGIFSYLDTTTENMIYNLTKLFKDNLYTIKIDIEDRILTDEENEMFNEFFSVHFFDSISDDLKNKMKIILEKNIIELKCDNNFFNINYNKYLKLIEILESKIISGYNNNTNDENSQKEVLILVNNECVIENIKSIFNIYGLSKKNVINNSNNSLYKDFFEFNLRKFLMSKREFLNRINIILSYKGDGSSFTNYFKENLLLQFLSFQLTQHFDIKHEGLFDKLYEEYTKDECDNLLPSEFAIEITENMFNEFISQSLHGDEAFPNLKIEFLEINNVRSREYYEKEINLNRKLREKDHNFSIVILFDYDTSIMRFLENYIVNYKNNINRILMFIDENFYNLEIDFNKIKTENIYFEKLIEEIKKDSNNNLNNNDNSNININNNDINNNDTNENNINNINDNLINNNINNENNNKSNFINSSKKKTNINITNSINIANNEERNILVDYREMGTKTPFYLYQNGFNIINTNLEIGDYILSNNYCIERKSISTKDLYQSLNSKHLMNQVVKMTEYFCNIILLIEFEEKSDIYQTFDRGIFYKDIFLQKFLDLINIVESRNKNIYFIWSLNCEMSAIILKNLRLQLKQEILDIGYCKNLNKINIKCKKNKSCGNEKNEVEKNGDAKNTKIESFFTNKFEEKENDKDENNIEKFEIKKSLNLTEQKKKQKLNVSLETIIRTIPGINTNNYHLVDENFNNLFDFVSADKNKIFEIFGRINGNKMLTLFDYEYQ